MKKRIWAVLACCTAAGAHAASTDFDGAEGAVLGTEAFAHAGAAWSGGRIETDGIPGLFATGDFHYEVSQDGARVVFDPPAADVRLFYVHGFGVPAGTARALDARGATVATADSRRATTHGAPANYVALSGAAPIAEIAFSGGAVDALTWSAAASDGLRYGTAINGTWLGIEPAPFLAGQGVALEYLPENRLVLLTWYTYGPAADGATAAPRWLVGTGQATEDGAELTLYATGTGRFNAPSPVQQTAVGTARVQFTACDAARIDYALPGEQAAGTLQLRTARALLAGYDCR